SSGMISWRCGPATAMLRSSNAWRPAMSSSVSCNTSPCFVPRLRPANGGCVAERHTDRAPRGHDGEGEFRRVSVVTGETPPYDVGHVLHRKDAVNGLQDSRHAAGREADR